MDMCLVDEFLHTWSRELEDHLGRQDQAVLHADVVSKPDGTSRAINGKTRPFTFSIWLVIILERR